MPSLRFIIPLENILFSTKMITSLRSVIILGGEKEQKWQLPYLMPKTKWLRHFNVLLQILRIKASIFFCPQMAAPF